LSNEKLKLVEIDKFPREFTLVNGLPDVGLVGAIAASYMVKNLKMWLAGYLDSDLMPPVLVFHDEKPMMPVRLYAGESIVVLVSEVAIPPDLMPELAKVVIEWASGKGVKRVVTLGGIPVPNRIDIEKPLVVAAAILEEDRKFLKDLRLEVLKEGFLSGMYALMAKECMRRNIPCITLLAQSHLNYPDPGAAASVLEALSKMLGFPVDVKPLLDEEEEIRLKLRELMKRTMSAVRAAPKGYEHTPPLMYA